MTEEPNRGQYSGFVLSLLIGVLVLPVLLMAQPRVASDLTEDVFLETLDSTHPAVAALADELASAEGELRSAGVWANPSLEFEHEAPSDQAEQSTLTLGWKPPLNGRRGLAIKAGRASVEAASRRFEWAQLLVRQDMRAIFAEWALAQHRQALIEQHFESLRGLQQRLDLRAERGEESQLASRRFALAVLEVGAQLARTEADLSRARGRALTLRGDLPAGATPVLSEAPPVPASLVDSARPDLQALRSDVEAAQFRRRAAGRVLEFPSLFAGWTRVSQSSEQFGGPALGLSWELPLFDRNQGVREETTRTLAVAEARLRLIEREATERRQAALSAYTALRASLTQLAPVAREAPEITASASALFLAGESSMTDLLETLRSVLQSQLDVLELHSDVLSAHRELELSVGRALTQGES